MKDQNNNPVPDDLVLLENSTETLQRAAGINGLEWFTIRNKGELFVSDKAITRIIGSHDFLPISDVYPLLRQGDVFCIDKTMKRWNLKDGFYHV